MVVGCEAIGRPSFRGIRDVPAAWAGGFRRLAVVAKGIGSTWLWARARSSPAWCSWSGRCCVVPSSRAGIPSLLRGARVLRLASRVRVSGPGISVGIATGRIVCGRLATVAMCRLVAVGCVVVGGLRPYWPGW